MRSTSALSAPAFGPTSSATFSRAFWATSIERRAWRMRLSSSRAYDGSTVAFRTRSSVARFFRSTSRRLA
jgi:hypothetical protein